MALPTTRRPDGRVFGSLQGVAPEAYERELRDTIDTVGRLFLNVDLADTDLVSACVAAGMTAEFVSQSYAVPFASAIARCRPQRESRRHDIVSAEQVDGTQLFRLDIALRQDVPGTRGWVGNRGWFDDEMASKDYSSSGYLVAQDDSDGRLVGLIRFWKGAGAPRLGLLGVLPHERSGWTANALLRAGLLGAAEWGSPTFMTNTARPALQRRLLRYGATHTGSFAQMTT